MKILITGAYNASEKQIEKIKELGFEVYFHADERERVSLCEIYDAVLCNGLFLHNDIKDFVNLKYIQLTSAGLDRVPLEYIKSKGIVINSARGVYSIPMAEFAVSGVLQLYKQVRFFFDNQKKHKWEKHRGLLELSGKNVLIAGCGSVGDECAKRFSAFGCSVFGIDVLNIDKPWYKEVFLLDKMGMALKSADIVVLTLPLTEDTKHLLNEDTISGLKKDAILVNIARGGIVDTNAIIKVLEQKKLYGAVLDVFEEEPLSEKSMLWDMENVILTPHNSFVGEGNNERLFELILKNLKGWKR